MEVKTSRSGRHLMVVPVAVFFGRLDLQRLFLGADDPCLS